MKLSILILLSLTFSARAIPSREVVYDEHRYSVKNRFKPESFVGEIKDDSMAPHDDLGFHPEFEVVSGKDQHLYKDFNDDAERYGQQHDDFHGYEGYDDVIPKEVRISGQSLETEGSYGDNPSNGGNDGNDDKTDASTRGLQSENKESHSRTAHEAVNDDLDLVGNDIEDVTVKGLSEYSYLVGDKLHGLNEMKFVGAMKGGERVLFEAGNNEWIENLDKVGGRSEDLSYSKFDEHRDDEGPGDVYGYGYGYVDDLTVKGQAIEHETGDDREYDDYDEDDETANAERYENEDWDDRDDEFDIENDLDYDVHSVDRGEGDGSDIPGDGDEEYITRQHKETGEDTHVQGMSLKEQFDGEEDFQEDEDELNDESSNDVQGLDRQEYDEDDSEDDDEYVHDADRLEDEFVDDDDNEYWDDDGDAFDPALRVVDEAPVDAGQASVEDVPDHVVDDDIKIDTLSANRK